MTRNRLTRFSVTLAAVSFSLAAAATDVTGAGSSFVYPVLTKWSAHFAAATGHHVNYQSIGSGGGIAQIKAGTVDFGASDKPLDADQLAKFGLGQFPSVIGGIVPVFNVAGIAPGALTLDGTTLAAIFRGTVTRWNAPAITKLNPGLALPDAGIIVVHRADGSGTSFNFTHYLAQVSTEWQAEVGVGTQVDWPTGIGGKGNEGVAAYVRQMRGSIGYVEYAYALKSQLGYARLINAAGTVVSPGTESFQAAAATADWSQASDFNVILTNAPGANAWPITATTWIIAHKRPRHAARGKAAFEFFRWSLRHGQADAAALDYVPLPPALVERIETYWQREFRL